MDRPQSRRQRAQLNTFHAAAFDKRDRILEVVVRILRTIGCEDATWRHWFTIDRFDDAHFVSADLDQWNLAHNFFKRKLDQVQAGLQHVSLNADFAFSGHYSSGRHLCSKVSSFLDRDFARADVDENTFDNDEEENEEDKRSEKYRQQRSDI